MDGVGVGRACRIRRSRTQPVPKAGKPINAGDVLSGELNAMRVRDGKKGKRVATYQLTSEPRRLPPPNGLCNLETGPETFQLITSSEAQAAQLKILYRQGDLGEGRRSRLCGGRRPNERSRGHQMERGDQALGYAPCRCRVSSVRPLPVDW